MNPIPIELDEDFVKQAEEHAFYESGLSAHGCFEDLDDYAKQAIHKYGRILLRIYGGKMLEVMFDKIIDEHKNDFIIMQNER